MIITPASLKIIGAALLLFGAGVVTGSFGTSAFKTQSRNRHYRTPAPSALEAPVLSMPRSPSGIAASTTNRRPERVSGRPPGWQRFEALRRIEDQIQLSPEQKERIRGLVRESEQRLRKDWEPVVPRIQSEVRDLRRKIAAELNPDQVERFDELLERREGAAPGKATRRSNSVPASVR